MEGRIGWLVAFFRRAEPREPTPSRWGLALDAAIAAAAAGGAVYEVRSHYLNQPGTASVTVSGTVAAVRHALLVGLPLRKLGPPVITGPPAHALLLVLAAAFTALPLAGRRLYPITAWLVIIAAIITLSGTFVPPVALVTAAFAAYSALAHSRYRNLAIAVVCVTTAIIGPALGNGLPRFSSNLTAIFGILPAAGVGLGIRELRHRLADSTAKLRRAAADAAAATERALAAERARIASELHDVVTHNVSVMIVQAGAARKIMASSPADAENALLAVESTGREAMTELRNLLGVLSPAADGRDSRSAGAGAATGPRPGGGSVALSPQPALRPQPGLGELQALIGRVSAAGLPVKLQVSGEPRPLSLGADLAAYRVVQEGLTNVLRHAGPAAATVGVKWGEKLVITVSDDGDGSGLRDASDGNGASGGSGASGGNGSGAQGRGLLGLRERLELYGGELAAGPRPGGGWQVRAVMPTGSA